jgi:uncharacterized protein
MNDAPFFVNLPVADVARARAFYEALGFRILQKYTSDQSACFILREGVHLMLLQRSHFEKFSRNPSVDPTRESGVVLCFECSSRADVDRMVGLAISAGGSAPEAPSELSFMYSHGFIDPDGHPWKLNYMFTNT